MAAVAERRELQDAGVAEMQEGMEDLELAGPIPIQQLQVSTRRQHTHRERERERV